MLTATFRRLGGAARLPFLDFLISNLAFDFAFDFDFAFLALGGPRSAWIEYICPKTRHGQGPSHDASQGLGINRAPLRQASRRR